MPKKPKRHMPGGGAPGREVEIPLVYRYPKQYTLYIDAHNKWLRMFKRAEAVVADDMELQTKARQGLMIKDRKLPPEILGRLYVQYCELINEMYDAYLNNVQLQRAEYIQEIVSILVKRMMELRNELVHIIVNDYIFVDSSLQQLFRTPYDIQIVPPYHFAVDSRPDSVEEMLHTMWRQAIRREKKRTAPPKRKSKELKPITSLTEDLSKEQVAAVEEAPAEEVNEEVEEEEEEEDEVEQVQEETVTQECKYTTLIQRHERYRKYYIIDKRAKAAYYRLYFAPKDIPEPSDEVKRKAASIIQRIYRQFMEVKRERVKQHKRDVLLGLIPDFDLRPVTFREANTKMYERRRQTRKKLEAEFQKQKERIELKFFLLKIKEKVAEDISEEIHDWFKQWYYGCDNFPQYPYDTEGGTLLVVTGQYPTIEEQELADDKFRKETMGKTKEQLDEEKKRAKQEELDKLEIAREKEQKMADAIERARANPDADLGYGVKTSENNQAIIDTFIRYRMAWGFYDDFDLPNRTEVIYGFMKPLIQEDLLAKMQIEVREVVDEMMRLELKLLMKALQYDYDQLKWKFKKQEKRKKPKKAKELKPFIVDKERYKSLEPLFDLNIISKPTERLDDVLGDLNFAAYEANIKDPDATFPPPGYGDVKRRLALSCVFGSGMEPAAPRNKAVMLIGLEHNGKTFLANACAGEMGAVKFDISPEAFSSKATKIPKMLSLVFTAARVFQPAVIFLKDIEKVFTKTVLPEDLKLNATKLKPLLKKLIKGILPTDKIIFIATCSNPFVATMPPMFKLFNEVILVPSPDYGTLQRFFYNKFQSIRSMPRDFCTQALAKVMQGLGFGAIMDIYNNVMTSGRICKLNITPLSQAEFIEYMIENEIEQMTAADYQKLQDLVIRFSPLNKERESYKIINMKRADAYQRLEESKAKKAK